MKRMMTLAIVLVLSLVALQGAAADEILFGFRPVPPYVMENAGKAPSGMEYDIIVAALAYKGHTVKPVMYPLARLIETMKTGTLQAAAPLLPVHNIPNATMSDVYLVYNNVAMAMKARQLQVATVLDLKKYSIMAFGNAKNVLGADFKTAAEASPNYMEEAEQITQIKLLFAGRIDVVVGESRILRYFIKAPSTGVDAKQEVVEYRVFPPTEYRVAFLNPQHAKDFNAGLAAIKKNGTYDAIIKKYSN
ncbi:MAG: transporter substrate-binding domain-containing protein [Spirochaetales bacterium]|nr:transporter substrate-binding domain-containing protein [Spirochaetales bacterium]